MTDIQVPALPESVSDAVVAKWYKKVGDAVSNGENIVDLETDKVMLEVPCTVDGVIEAITAPEGETVTAGAVIAVVKEGAVAEVKPAAKAQDEPAEKAVPAPVAAPTPLAKAAPAPAATQESLDNLTPSQRRKQRDGKAVAGAAAAMPARTEERVPMSRLRQKVAERLVDVQHTAALLTTFNEVNMKPVMDLRKQYKEKFEKVHGTRLGFMSFFTKACVEALKRFPAVNGSIDGKDILYHNYFDIGIAVGSDRGLVVPILRDADQMSMADIESTIRDFGARAKTGKIAIEEMTGGTFTITNGGTFGSMMSTPIVNAPQSAILGMHNIVERAVVENGEVVVRPMMYLALTYDHRIIDGSESVRFLVTIKELLEDPARMLLDV